MATTPTTMLPIDRDTSRLPQAEAIMKCYLLAECGRDYSRKPYGKVWHAFANHLRISHASLRASRRVVTAIVIEMDRTGIFTREEFLRLYSCVDPKFLGEHGRIFLDHSLRNGDAKIDEPEPPLSGHESVICNLPSKYFYASPEWKELRYLALERYGNRCACCGRSPKDRVTMHVDHIKPRSLYPALALKIHNLQILCEDCNKAKSNKFDTDWRDDA